MSEPQNNGNIHLNIVSEDELKLSQNNEENNIDDKNIETQEINSVYGYTQHNNDNNVKNIDLKSKSIINRFLLTRLIKKLREKNRNTFEKMNTTGRIYDIKEVERNKLRVKNIIREGAIYSKTEKPSPDILVKTSIRPKDIGKRISKQGTIPTVRDSAIKPANNTIPFSIDMLDLYMSSKSDKSNSNNLILESTLKNIINEVNNNSINDLESLITKIRVEYTNKVETDSTQLILLNFEDDSFRPVIKIDDNYINIINNWYDICKQIMDIEETHIVIPNMLKYNNDITRILYKNINCKHKDLFIKSFVPEILNNIVIQERIRTMESQMSICINRNTDKSIITKSQTVSDLNINIPQNMLYTEDYFYKKGCRLVSISKNDIVDVDIIKDNAICKNIFSCSPSFSPDAKIYTFKEKSNVGCLGLKNEIKEKPKTDSGSSFTFPLKSTKIPLRTLQKDISLNSQLHINTQKDCFEAYNSEYDCLNPPFGSNAKLIDSNFNDVTNIITSKLIIVLINFLFFQTIMIVDPDLQTLETIFKCTEYGFTELFTLKIKTTDEEIEALIKKQFDTVIFNNAEELNQVLLSTSQFIECIKNKQERCGPLVEEEKSVKEFLKKYFDISEDVNKKMKASSLYDIVTKSELCIIDKSKIQGFKNRLSNYLKEIGLQKKRYNDGYYYYGIVEKDLLTYQSSRLDFSKEIILEDILKDREMMNKEIRGNPDFYM